ncbi:MAG: uroporphyrinogen-III synthase [Rhodobacteraceae bacterium]|nr:uroporphyrinogen-III synthase [Paracoccaceae bacterium]
MCHTLLLTRPRPQSIDFLAALTSGTGREPDHVISPLLHICYTPVTIPEGVQAVLFTSANGVRAAGSGCGQTALCVGQTTANAAKAAGFDATSANGDITDLAALAIQHLNPEAGSLIHIAGRHHAGDLGGILSKAGFSCQRAIGYEARPVELSAEARVTLVDIPVVVPVFSSRSGQLLAEAIDDIKPAELTCVAISESAATPLRGRASVVARPTRAAMIKALRDLL